MPRMQRRAGSIRGLLWAVVSALVLKAAVPLFAAGAAYLQGVPVGSICGIYGVTLPSVKADPHAGHHGHHAQHRNDSPAGDAPSHTAREHCALTGLAAMAVPDIATPPPVAIRAGTQREHRIECAHPRDACAAWAARLQHPPPA
jgi:hypothetical protein